MHRVFQHRIYPTCRQVVALTDMSRDHCALCHADANAAGNFLRFGQRLHVAAEPPLPCENHATPQGARNSAFKTKCDNLVGFNKESTQMVHDVDSGTPSHPAGQASGTARCGGFSLVELLITVAVMVALAAIATPVYLSQKQKAYDASAQVNVTNLSHFLWAANSAGRTVTGGDGPTSATLDDGDGTIAKNGARVYTNAAGTWCISQVSQSTKIWVATSENSTVYRATAGCTAATTLPTKA